VRARASLAVAFGLLVAGCGGGGEAGSSLGRALTASASLTPTTHLFAEPVVARLVVVVDADELDPDRIRVKTSFDPYDIVGSPRQIRSSFGGGLTRLRYEYTLRCLLIECIPQVLTSAAGEDETGRGERITTTFNRARVLYSDSDAERVLRNVAWPSLQSVSRINPEEIPRFGFVFRTSTPIPEATYPASPTLVGGALLVGALALLALPAVLVARWSRRRRPLPDEEAPEVPPLERALLLVESTAARENGSERRGALEMLAVELDASERAGLAAAARDLAWGRVGPSPEAAGTLVTTVREADGRPV
jgi:hypothetical protein